MADLVKVAETSELAPGQMTPVQLDDRLITLANVAGEYYAFSATCPHQGGLLYEGTLYGYEIDCPLHHYMYDVRTGENVFPRNVYPLKSIPKLLRDVISMRTYQVRVVGQDVLLERPS